MLIPSPWLTQPHGEPHPGAPPAQILPCKKERAAGLAPPGWGLAGGTGQAHGGQQDVGAGGLTMASAPASPAGGGSPSPRGGSPRPCVRSSAVSSAPPWKAATAPPAVTWFPHKQTELGALCPSTGQERGAPSTSPQHRGSAPSSEVASLFSLPLKVAGGDVKPTHTRDPSGHFPAGKR